jgi:hypothetical protein
MEAINKTGSSIGNILINSGVVTKEGVVMAT